MGALSVVAATGNRRLLRFDIADPDFQTPAEIRHELARALERPDASHYARIRGLPAFTKAVASFYRREFGVDADGMDEVLSTVGSGEGLFIVLSSMVGPGDEFILPNPTFPNYASLLHLFGGVARFVTTGADFHLDVAAIERAVTRRTKGVIICTPNNPTGAVYTREELALLLQLCDAHNLIIIADESYSQLTYDGRRHCSIASLRGARARTIVVNGLSKAYAMTGWRLGYVMARPDFIEQFEKIGYEIHGAVNTAVQYAGVVALRQSRRLTGAWLAQYESKRELMVEGLRKAGVSCHRPEGGFEVFPQVPAGFAGSMAFAKHLVREAGVLTKPGLYFGPDGDRHCRLVYCRDDRVIREGLRRIERALALKPRSGPRRARRVSARRSHRKG